MKILGEPLISDRFEGGLLIFEIIKGGGAIVDSGMQSLP